MRSNQSYSAQTSGGLQGRQGAEQDKTKLNRPNQNRTGVYGLVGAQHKLMCIHNNIGTYIYIYIYIFTYIHVLLFLFGFQAHAYMYVYICMNSIFAILGL